MGKMQEIKELLQSGKSVKEIVELGYKKPSIYKMNKQLKDTKKETIVSDTKESADTSDKLSFQKETNQPIENSKESSIKEILEDNPVESDNPISDNSDNPVDEKEEPESIMNNNSEELFSEETFEDDAAPFREFGGINISRDNVDVSPIHTDLKSSDEKGSAKTGSVGVTELLTEVFGTIGILTGHDFWDLSKKDQKVLKHLCKLPGLEKFLHKFGLYGCVFGLFTITFKRIKEEIKLNKTHDEKPVVKADLPPPLTGRTDIPTNIFESVPE